MHGLSIRQRLSLHLLLVGSALALLGSLLAGWLVARQVNELLDYQLEQVARSLVANDLSLRRNDRPEDPARHLLIRIVDPVDGTVYESDDDVRIDTGIAQGFSDQVDRAGTYPEGLRVFTLQGPRRLIQVMQPLSLRTTLRREAAWDALLPALVTLGGLIVALGAAVRNALRPLDRLSDALRQRQPDSLEPVQLQPCPRELQAPVASLNDLLTRLQRARSAQQRFVGDAAHELRTPMAALRLQVQALTMTTDPAQRTEQEARLLGSIDRCTHLITQLMALAREDEAPPQGSPRHSVSLRTVASEVLVNLSAMAAQRDVELALEEGEDATVPGVAGDLQRLLANLVDNAIKHAPAHSAVSVSVRQRDGQAEWVVDDRGPGMSPSLRPRAFDRFFRGQGDQPGAGLGLSIAAQIAQRHQARIELGDRDDGPGLRAVVRFTPPTR